MSVLVNGEWVPMDQVSKDDLVGWLLPPMTGNNNKLLKVVDGGLAWVAGSGGGAEIGETSDTAYRGDRGKIAYEHSQAAHAPVDAVAQANTYTDQEVAALAAGTSTALSGKSDVDHAHDYAAVNHNHDGVYAPAVHSHPDPFTKYKLGADVSTAANTTPVVLPGLSFSYEANSTYLIDLFMMCQSPTSTTGYGFQLDVSSGVTDLAMTFYHQLANTGTLSGGSSIADNASAGVSSGVPTNGTKVPVMGSAILVTGANSGTAQLMFRSEVNAVATCRANSTMRVHKAF